jgi:conjugative transfer signal peptidase TraF
MLVGAFWISVVVAGRAGYRLNRTASAPGGVWHITPVGARPILRGTLVLICPADWPVVTLMRDRGYLPRGDCPTGTVPIFKRVIAVGGDTVTVTPGAELRVNGKIVPNSAPVAGVPPWEAGTFPVRADEVWVVSRFHARSFDSRYFGPVRVSWVRGFARPVLVWGNPEAM